MEPARKKFEVIASPRAPQAKFDYQERCRCGHYRYEHNSQFGCMNWDERRTKGWCDCDGFADRRMLAY